MGRKKLWRKYSAARARAAKAALKSNSLSSTVDQSESEGAIPISSNSDADECTQWTGGVNHELSGTESDLTWVEASTADGSESSGDNLSEVEGDDIVESVRASLEHEIRLLAIPTQYEQLSRNYTAGDWKKAEKNRSLGYNGHSDRTKRREAKTVRDKEIHDKEMRKM